MSYSVDWISPIYDRTYADVINAELDRYLVEPIGCYNAVDLNRIENNTKYVMEDMLAREIIKVPPTLAIKLTWKETDIPTREDMIRIVQNVQLLMSLSNPEVLEDFDIIYESTQFTYALANAIERNLWIMKNQPRLPIAKWLLKINNGRIIESNSSQMFLAENETVNIQFVPFGEDAEFMGFTHWSGNTDDLQYVGNINSMVTTYQMQYHDTEDYVVELTGNYEYMIPRTLKLNSGTIYDDIGGSTRQFFPGNEVLILADVAPIGKRFHEWRGTQEALDNINGGPEPSTSWLVMPDCDVELTAFYINAGQHKVTVDGTLVGWFDYGETVDISYSDRGDKYTFLYWSGDTEYLDDISTSSSFKMPDVDVNLSSNWKFMPDQVQLVVNNGTGSGMYDENGSAYITADIPSEGMGFYGWTLDEGYGGFSDSESPSTMYYFGGTNAVVTAHFKPIRSVVLNNINNSGTSQILSVMEDTYFVVNSTEIVGDQILDYWRADNGEKINLPYFTERMGSEDRVFTAVYRNRNTFHLTVNYGDGDGDYLERGTAWVSADQPPSGKQFSHWSRSSDIWSIDSPYSATTYVTIGHDDCYVTANYEDIPDNPGPGPGGGGTPVDPPPERPTYHFTVIDGAGDGDYYEGQHVTAYGNEPPSGYEFSHWTENDTIISYYTPYYFYMPANDRTITAHYKEIPSFTITVINGKTENGTSIGTFKRNSSPLIYMDPAPEGMKFLQWEIIEGVDEDIQHILAETTRIRNLTHNVTVKATYYVPNPDILYTLAVTDKLGNVVTSNHPVGEQVPISADEPDEGYKFFKWVGDTQYVIDKYSPDTLVNMPPKNIELQMEYRREGFTTVYHVIIYGGELLVDTDPETGEQHWDIEGEFEEGTKVQIRAIDIPIGWRFNGWKNDDDEGKSVSTVNDLLEEETFLTVQDFDITLTRDVIEKDKYAMAITDGEISGTYYEGNPVPIYFNLEDTELTHYSFVRWSGADTAKLRLFGSSSKFDITVAGTPDYPQTISMPATNIAISAVYTSTHRLLVNGEVHGYYEENTEISISAAEQEGKRFTYWTGDVSYVDNKYNPNIKVTMPKGAITLIPNYHSLNDNNCIGYSLTSLSTNDTINIEDIVIISGEVDIGFLITDSDGHIFIVTGVTDTTATIMRLTTIEGGGEDVQ